MIWVTRHPPENITEEVAARRVHVDISKTPLPQPGQHYLQAQVLLPFGLKSLSTDTSLQPSGTKAAHETASHCPSAPREVAPQLAYVMLGSFF
jgi:hypothetical protein